jgi:hypothetical protein
MPSGSDLKFSDIFKQASEIWLRRNAHGSIRVQERQPDQGFSSKDPGCPEPRHSQMRCAQPCAGAWPAADPAIEACLAQRPRAQTAAGPCCRDLRLTCSVPCWPVPQTVQGCVGQQMETGHHRRVDPCRRCARNPTFRQRSAPSASCPSPGAGNGGGTGTMSAIALTGAERQAKRGHRARAVPDVARTCPPGPKLPRAPAMPRADPAGPAPCP